MREHYSDIIERAGDPVWFDEHGVPRYCDPHPLRVADIYARAVVFAVISCQRCRREFLVAFSESPMTRKSVFDLVGRAEAEGSLFYGDPPNVGCCDAGASMTADFVRVVSAWRKPGPLYKWGRVS